MERPRTNHHMGKPLLRRHRQITRLCHKEWNGLLRDFYYKRWEKYWQVLQDQLDGKLPVLPVGNSSTPTADNPAMTIDWYALEEPWTLAKNIYAASAEGDCIEVAKEAITLINN